MTQSLRLKLFIKGVFVGSWGRKQVLENSHQEASQKVLSKAILGGRTSTSLAGGRGVGKKGLRSLPPPHAAPVPDILYCGVAPLPALALARRCRSS